MTQDILMVWGDANLSRTLEQIRETSEFQDLCSIVWDKSDTIPLDTRNKNFFFGKRTNLQLIFEYCMLSKIDMDEPREELDESNLIIVEEFNRIMNFYNLEKLFEFVIIIMIMLWTSSVSL